MTASFAEVVALAKDRTPGGRRRLATRFSRAFFDHLQGFSSAERSLALDILTALLRDAALEVRRELAGTLAREKSVPHSLVFALANDVIEVAQPVLSYSPVLTEPDLLAVIEHQSVAHRVAIARRSELGPVISATLAVRRETPVSLALLDNIAIHLSDATLRVLAQQALDDIEISDSLAQRAELTGDVATQIYWLIGQELQVQIRNRFDLNPLLLDKALNETITRLAHQQGSPATRRSLAERLIAGGIVSGNFLIDLLKNRGTELFRELLRELTGLRTEAADVLCRAEGSEPLALVCRALGYSKTETAHLLMMVRDRVAGEAQFDPSMLADALSTYSRLTVGDANTVLWQWQSDPGYLLSLENRRLQ